MSEVNAPVLDAKALKAAWAVVDEIHGTSYRVPMFDLLTAYLAALPPSVPVATGLTYADFLAGVRAGYNTRGFFVVRFADCDKDLSTIARDVGDDKR